jgi:hypothetical protein
MSEPPVPSSEQVRDAAERFKAAIDAHLTACEQRSSDADPAVQEAYDTLRQVGLAYDDLLFDAYEEVTPFEAPDVTDDEEWAALAEAGTVSDRLSVLSRRDFTIADPAELIEAGRAAYLELFPDDVEAQADERVTDPGAAVQQMLQAYGQEGVEERADDSGLVPEGSTTWVLAAVEPPADWREHAFTGAHPRRLVARYDEVFEEEDEAAYGDGSG